MFAQAMLTAVPDQLFTWALRQQTWLQRELQKLSLKKAQARAFQRFAREYPQWAASLFDQHFIANHAAPLLWDSIRQGQRPAPAAIALAWFEQCKAPGAVAEQRDLFEVTAVAAAFLRHLDAELQSYQAIGAGVSFGAPSAAYAVTPPIERTPDPSPLFAAALRGDSDMADSNLEMDWLWLATQLSSPSERGYCLRRALEINPNSEIAKRELARLRRAKPGM